MSLCFEFLRLSLASIQRKKRERTHCFRQRRRIPTSKSKEKGKDGVNK